MLAIIILLIIVIITMYAGFKKHTNTLHKAIGHKIEENHNLQLKISALEQKKVMEEKLMNEFSFRELIDLQREFREKEGR